MSNYVNISLYTRILTFLWAYKLSMVGSNRWDSNYDIHNRSSFYSNKGFVELLLREISEPKKIFKIKNYDVTVCQCHILMWNSSWHSLTQTTQTTVLEMHFFFKLKNKKNYLSMESSNRHCFVFKFPKRLNVNCPSISFIPIWSNFILWVWHSKPETEKKLEKFSKLKVKFKVVTSKEKN